MTFPNDTQPNIPPLLSPEPPARFSFMRVIMITGTLCLSACFCFSIIALAGMAGLRDELHTVGTEAAATQLAEVETQYFMGEQDASAGRYEMAAIRFGFVATEMPDYLDALSQLEAIQAQLSITPTPSPSPTLNTTQTPTSQNSPQASPDTTQAASVTPEANANDPLNSANLFGLAQTAMNFGDYEEAIEWLEALVLVDPNYRRAEVREMRLNAYIAQGRIYLRGQNDDGEDRLAQGVQLINRASELGEVSGELLYEADFIARYLAARAYVDGGAYEQAREVLTQLCQEDCSWSYAGVSVQDLLWRSGG